MVNAETPTVRLYVRERGGKRNFYPAPRNPDLAACYWLRYEKDEKPRQGPGGGRACTTIGRLRSPIQEGSLTGGRRAL